MTDVQPLITIKDWQNGLADSPNLGLALLRNVDIESYPGATRTQKVLTSMTNYIVDQTFVMTGGFPNFCSTSASLIPQATVDDGRSTYAGAAVMVSSTGTLPAPLAANTVYYMAYIANQLFGVATTYANAIAGSFIAITTAGTGVHTVTHIAMGTPNFMTQDPKSGFIFAIDDVGKVWNTHNDNVFNLLNDANASAAGKRPGLMLFRVSNDSKTYLFALRGAGIDVIEVTATANVDTPSWTNAWQTPKTAFTHAAILAQDNIIYYADGNVVGSIKELSGQVFDPANSATYNFNSAALATLPINEVAYCFEQLGNNLLIGGLSFNKIYPWDRVSSSYNLPLICPENAIYGMKNSGNLVYIFAGTKGNVYRTSGGFVGLFKSVPGYLTNNAATIQANTITWGDSAVRNGAILFGMASNSNSSFNGVYLLYPDGRLLQDNTSYAGAVLPTAILTATSNYAGGIITTLSQDFYRIGYAGGADHSNNTRYAKGTFATVLQSMLYRVGNKRNLAKLSRMEVQIARPASAGNIRVSFRRDLASAFTVIATFVADGISTSFSHDGVAVDIENIQFQVEHDGDIEFMEARLYP